jgi:hypothetical protein
LERDFPIEIFTTNYDLLLEQAFEERRRPYFDGFVGVREPFFDNASIGGSTSKPLPPRFTRLWKIHGSINWFLTADGDVTRTPKGAGGRRLIHPSHLKYDESRQMPYLALLDRLRTFLGQRGALLVTCGYSFGDQHTNAIVTESLAANPTANVTALLHDPLASYDEAARLARSLSNLNTFARDLGIVGTREAEWTTTGTSSPTTIGFSAATAGGTEFTLGNFNELGRFLASMLDRLDGGS